jgi:hypothetical protein
MMPTVLQVRRRVKHRQPAVVVDAVAEQKCVRYRPYFSRGLY